MNSNKLLLSLASLFLLAVPNHVRAADVTLSVTGLENIEGLIHWAIFDNAESYASGDKPITAARSKAPGATLSVTMHDLPAGRYAVRLFNDANGNGEFDRNMLGIPREGYGFSNNAGVRGPASFEDAAISIHGHTTITVGLR